MELESFFNQHNIIDLSFFNFANAITGCYFANSKMEILKVNKTFTNFFPVLGNVSNAYFPDVLAQLGVEEKEVERYKSEITKNGRVMIPEIKINIGDDERMFSLLSAKTHDNAFSYLNGIQGQFVDRTNEWQLKKEREALLAGKEADQKMIQEKSQKLETLAKRLAKYLSPQIYNTIFEKGEDIGVSYARKNLTLFFSDIVSFTDLSDRLEPESLAEIINSYLSEMSTIALDMGGTIDKFIGDAVVVFFGDPESRGETEDALACVEMAIRMRSRIQEMQKHWIKLGAPDGIKVRTGIATGFCTVGNFGSDLRMDYTVLGSPVNMAARLEGKAKHNTILIEDKTYSLIKDHVKCRAVGEFTPKGFAKPVRTYEVNDFIDREHVDLRHHLSIIGKRVEVNILDSSDIKAAILELKNIEDQFEKEIENNPNNKHKNKLLKKPPSKKKIAKNKAPKTKLAKKKRAKEAPKK